MGASGECPDYPSTSAKPLPTTMPLQGDVYVVENNPSTYIIRLERCEGSNDHPGVGFRETKLENLIARMESKGGHWDDWETMELCVDRWLSEIPSLDVGSIGRSWKHRESIQTALQHQPNHLQQQCCFRGMSMSSRTTLPPISSI